MKLISGSLRKNWCDGILNPGRSDKRQTAINSIIHLWLACCPRISSRLTVFLFLNIGKTTVSEWSTWGQTAMCSIRWFNNVTILITQTVKCKTRPDNYTTFPPSFLIHDIGCKLLTILLWYVTLNSSWNLECEPQNELFDDNLTVTMQFTNTNR